MNGANILTLGQAAKLAGRSKATISEALKTGRLSYLSKSDAGYKIEASELFRVFPPSKSPDGQTDGMADQDRTPDRTGAILAANAKIEGLEALLAEVRSERDDLRRRLDAESEERRKLVALLPPPASESPRPAPSLPRGWLRRLFG
jgi:hypothetical protein